MSDMPQSPDTKHGRLQEFVASQSTPIRVDAEKGILYDVLFLGHSSRNKADYSREVMQEALTQYDGALSYAGHTRDGSNPDPEKAFGVPRNCRVAEDGIRGEYHFPPKHRLAEDLVWRAQNAPRSVGFSHDAECDYTIQNGRRCVSKICRVFSVDYVTRPATTKGLFEDENTDEIAEPALRSLAETTLAGFDNARTALFADGLDMHARRQRMIEAIDELRGQLIEGEIGDQMKEDEPIHKMRRMRDIASSSIDNAMWDHSKYPTHANKKDRHLAVLSDWTKELKSLDCGGNIKEEEIMDLKALTVEELRTARPDLVSVLTGTDEHSRLTEEVKNLKDQAAAKDAELATLKASESKRLREEEIIADLKAVNFPTTDPKLFSTKFQEQLRAAPDKAARDALIADRLELRGHIQEAAIPAPLTSFGSTTAPATKADPSYDHLFTAAK